MIKIILAEGHNVVRNGIKSLLDKETDIEVVAEVRGGEDVLNLLDAGTFADIVIAPINMAGIGGIELITQIKQKYPAIKSVVLSSVDDEKFIRDAFKAGAVGYMLKSIDADELIYGIRHIQTHNERYLCNEVALSLLDKLIRIPSIDFINVADINMSKREIEVLLLISQGFTNQEIADKLYTSKRTVESHRKALTEKTGTRNTAALVRYAVLNNLIG